MTTFYVRTSFVDHLVKDALLLSYPVIFENDASRFIICFSDLLNLFFFLLENLIYKCKYLDILQENTFEPIHNFSGWINVKSTTKELEIRSYKTIKISFSKWNIYWKMLKSCKYSSKHFRTIYRFTVTNLQWILEIISQVDSSFIKQWNPIVMEIL